MGVTEAFTKSLPKVELHAHLSGSISKECLHEIWRERKSMDVGFELEDPLTALDFGSGEGRIGVDTFFPLFTKYIYTLRSTLPLVRRTTLSVLSSFAADGVVYLELRTTPQLLSDCTSKDQYVECVLDCFEEFGRQEMDAYLILSIDRKHSAAEAMQVVDLASKWKGKGVVGVDLCGDPRVPLDLAAVGPAVRKAKEVGLGVTCHFAEVEQSSGVEELRALLDLGPDRLGHVVCAGEEMKAEIADGMFALELCPSGNVAAGLTQGGFGEHHAMEWILRDWCGPVVLCTDDVGLFENPLSRELFLAAKHYDLNREDLLWLCDCGFDAMFGPQDAKERLMRRIEQCRKEITEYNMDRALGLADD